WGSAPRRRGGGGRRLPPHRRAEGAGDGAWGRRGGPRPPSPLRLGACGRPTAVTANSPPVPHAPCFASRRAPSTPAAFPPVRPRSRVDALERSRAHLSGRAGGRLVASRPSGCPSQATGAGSRPRLVVRPVGDR